MVMASLFRHGKRGRELQLAHALRSVPLFRDLPPDDLVTIWRRLAEVHVPAGTIICRRGDPGDRFYIVQAGMLEVRLGLGPAGVSIRRLGPGDFAGEMALLTGRPRAADVVVAEDAVLWALDRADFEAISSTSMPLMRALNHALCDLVIEMTMRVEEGETGTAKSPAGMRFGPYRVMAQIGAGGMAAIYSAVHVADETAVAIKVLPLSMGSAPEFQERLEREAAVLQRIDHPNVIKVLAVGEVGARMGGGCYLAMEWLPHALDRVLWAQYPEPLATASALRLAHGVAQGLAAVHAAGLVHRDVKPSNILLRADGSPVLTDFGLATMIAETAHMRRLTPSNVIVGTADYIAPEQVAGLPVDGRSDLYSLGVVLYEMLAGYVPFAGREPMATLRAHVEEAPPPLPPHVPPALRALVERALEKLPGDRFPSAAAMAAELEKSFA